MITATKRLMVAAFIGVWVAAVPNAGALSPRHVYVTPDELQGFGDFDGDGRLDAIVVDRASGNYRVGFQQADGALAWGGAQPTGIADASAMSVGKITDTVRDQIAVTGESANRIHIVTPDDGTRFTRPIAVSPDGIGPASVAAVDLGLPGNNPARHDLVAITTQNDPGSTIQRHLLQSLPAGINNSANIILGTLMERASRVRTNSGQPERFGAIRRGAAPGTDIFFVYNAAVAPSLPTLTSVSGLPSGCEFVHSRFTGTARFQYIFYAPGEATIYRVQTTAAGLLQTPTAHPLGHGAIDQVFVMRGTAGRGIFVIFNDGAEGVFFTLETGVPVEQQSFLPPPGGRLRGLLGYANGQAALLSGPVSGGGSDRVDHLSDPGGGFVAAGNESLGSAGAPAARANVFLFDGEPMVDPAAKLLETVQVPDWTSSLVIGGGSVSLTSEFFSGELAGLVGPSSVGIGSAPGGADFGLENQYRDDISVVGASSQLGLLPPRVEISPPPGEYASYPALSFSSPDPALLDADVNNGAIYYRTSSGTSWQSYVAGDAIPLPGNTLQAVTVEFFAESGAGRSPIFRAEYTFDGLIDTDRDGVPDFVEIARGLDPAGGADSDEDGYDDFTELVKGSDPNDPLDTPAERLSVPNTFDLTVTPLTHDGQGGGVSSRPAAGANVRVYSLGGQLLGQGITGTLAGHGDPTALFEGLPAEPRDGFVVLATDPNFGLDDGSSEGRELLGLVKIPDLTVGPVTYIYGGGDPVAAAADWIAQAQAEFGSPSRPAVHEDLGFDDVLKLLATERLLGLLLEARDPGFDPLSLTLTPFRDPGSLPAPVDDLLALQEFVSPIDPGRRLHGVYDYVCDTLENDNSSWYVSLNKLANEIYRISTTLTAGSPGLYPAPASTIRGVIVDSTLAVNLDPVELPGADAAPVSSYAAEHTLAASELVFANLAVRTLWLNLPRRTTAAFQARITEATFAGSVPLVERTDGGGELALFDHLGDGFDLPVEFDLPLGTVLQISAFTDRPLPDLAPATSIEVIEVIVVSVPSPQATDLDGNLLDDEFEEYFFGGSGDPWGDDDGDGFSNFQEGLEGTDPNSPTSFPAGDPLDFNVPPIQIAELASDYDIYTEFPSIYSSQVGFQLQTSPDLEVPFSDVPGTEALSNGFGVYSAVVPKPLDSYRFYRFRVYLK